MAITRVSSAVSTVNTSLKTSTPTVVATAVTAAPGDTLVVKATTGLQGHLPNAITVSGAAADVTWIKRRTQNPAGASPHVIWTGVVTAALTNRTITVTCTVGDTRITSGVFVWARLAGVSRTLAPTSAGVITPITASPFASSTAGVPAGAYVSWMGADYNGNRVSGLAYPYGDTAEGTYIDPTAGTLCAFAGGRVLPTAGTAAYGYTATPASGSTPSVTLSRMVLFAAPELGSLTSDFAAMPAIFDNNYGTVAIVDGEAALANTAGYSGLETEHAYLGRGTSAYLKVTPGHPRTGTYETLYYWHVDADNYIALYVSGATFQGVVRQAGANTFVTLAGNVYDPTVHAWWRIREAGGVAYFDTAPDGATWTNRGSLPHTLDLSAVALQVATGRYGAETSVPDTRVDNLNVTPAAPSAAAIASLVDTFPGPGLAAEWTVNGATVVDGQLAVNCGHVAGDPVFSSARSRPAYQWSGSQLRFEAPSMPGVVGDAANAQAWVMDSAPAVVVDRIGFEYVAAAGRLDFLGQTGATYDAIGVTESVPYDPIAHRWLGLRHTGTAIIWETSPDRATWTVRRTLATVPAWANKTVLQVSFEAFRSSGTNDTFRVDNVNAAPTAQARTVVDAAGAQDTASATGSYPRTVVDTAAASDTATFVNLVSSSAVDTAPVTDTTTSTAGYERYPIDAAPVADTATRAAAADRTAVEDVPVTDEATAQSAVAAEFADPADVADVVEFLVGGDVPLEDAVEVADSLDVETDTNRTAVDAAGAVDEFGSEAVYQQETVDAAAISDTARWERGLSGEVVDAVGVSDSTTAEVALTATVVDAVAATDTVSQVATGSRGLLERVPTVDSIDVTARGRVTMPVSPAIETDEAVIVSPTSSPPAPLAVESAVAGQPTRAAQANAPGTAETDTVSTPRPTGSYPTEQVAEWDLTFPAVVLVDDGEFAAAIDDADRVPVYVLKADWNRNGLYDHPLSDLTSLVEEVSVSRALASTLPAEVGLVEGYSSAELSVTLSGEITTVLDEVDERRNLILNPSFESHTLDWTTNGEHATTTMPRGQSAVTDTAVITPRAGAWYAYTRRLTAGDLLLYPTTLAPVTAGARYTGAVQVNRDGTANARLDIDWFNNAGTYLSTTTGAVTSPRAQTWMQQTVTGNAPGGAVRARIVLRLLAQPANAYARIDAALFERAVTPTAGTYFDGNSIAARWVGTANYSVSIRGGAEYAVRDSGRELDVIDAFAPYRFDSPLYGMPVLQTPIYLETGFLAGDGPRLARRFTGTVTRVHPASLARTVELFAMDPVARLRTTLTLSGVAMYDSIMRKRGPDAYRSRMNSQWLIDFALRRNGIYTSPPCRADAILSVTGHGSMIPEIGWGGAPEEFYGTYRGDVWQRGRFGGALCTRGGARGRWWLTEQVTAASGTGFGFSQWMALGPAGLLGGQYLTMDLTFDATCFVNFGIGSDGRPYLGFRKAGTNEVRATPGGYTPPGSSTWAFVGVHVTFASTAMTVRFRINQTTYTSTVTIASRGANWKPGVYITYNLISQYQNFQLWRGVNPPAAPWQGEDPNWVPQADLDPGGNELTGIPPLLGADAWDLIKTVTDAEGSTFQFDETGRPQFITTKGDQWYGRTKRIKEVICADRNLADLASTTDESTIRNVINIKTKTQLIGDWGNYFEAATVDQFDTPPGTSVFDIPIDPDVYDIPETRDAIGVRSFLVSLSSASFVFYTTDKETGLSPNWRRDKDLAAIKNYIRLGIVYADNPVEIVADQDVPAVYIRVARPEVQTMRIYITNYSNRTVRFAMPTTYSSPDNEPLEGEPALIIPARRLIEGPEQLETYTDNTSVSLYGPSSFDVGGGEERWRQTPQGFRPLAAEVLSTTAHPVPVLEAVDVPHDPRRKLGDRIVLRDPEGLGEVTASIVGLSQAYSTTGTSDRITVRPLAPPQ